MGDQPKRIVQPKVGAGRPVRFYRVRWNRNAEPLSRGEGQSKFYVRRSAALRLARWLFDHGFYVQVHEADRVIFWQELDDRRPS